MWRSPPAKPVNGPPHSVPPRLSSDEPRVQASTVLDAGTERKLGHLLECGEAQIRRQHGEASDKEHEA